MNLSEEIRQASSLSPGRKVGIAGRLSLPIMVAQLTTIVMQYIDAAMVSRLGAGATAAIGLVSSTVWLVGGVTFAACYGFSVQIAHAVGAGEEKTSRSIFRQGLLVCLLLSVATGALGAALALPLPRLLGAEEAIRHDAFAYFLTVMLFLPVNQLRYYAGSCLQAAGDTKTPGALSVLMCVLNVILNAVLIPETITLWPGSAKLAGALALPGAGLGVFGAALATGLSQLIVALILLVFAVRSRWLKIVRTEKAPLQRACLEKAFRIAAPAAFESGAISGAQVAATAIVAPLGSAALAANSLAVTAESLCYMPGYGLETSATTLVGQSLGAGRPQLAKSFAWITTVMGMAIMGGAGLLMYFLSPAIFTFLTPDETVRALGVAVLRIELIAEPFFGASIVAAGALRGAEDTLIPSLMNLLSIWCVRIPLSALLVRTLGLKGAWIAMCAELIFRGTIFLIRLARRRWEH